MPTITMELSEFQLLQHNAELDRQARVRAEDALAADRMGDPAGIVRLLVHALRAGGIPIARAFVANLSPEFVRYLPSPPFRVIADMLDAMPDVSIDDRELAIEFRAYADDIDRYTLARADRAHAESLRPEQPQPPPIGGLIATETQGTLDG
jgi:hypothetical protein